MTYRVLRSAHHPCRLRATAHPDCLPTCQEPHPTQSSSGLSSCEVCLTELSSLATRLNGLCSHEHPDCDGPIYIVVGAVTPRLAVVCKLPLCLSLHSASWPLLSTCVVGGCFRWADSITFTLSVNPLHNLAQSEATYGLWSFQGAVVTRC